MRRLLVFAIAVAALVSAAATARLLLQDPTEPHPVASASATDPTAGRASHLSPSAASAIHAAAINDAARTALIEAIEDHLTPTHDDLARARATLDLAPEATTTATTALIDGAEAVLGRRYGEAKRRLDAAIAGGDELIGGYLIGRMQLDHGAAEQALGEFERVLTLRPGWPPARFGLADASSRLAPRTANLKELQRAVSRWPSSGEAAAAFGRAMEGLQGDPEAGLEWYARAVAAGYADPHTVERYTTLYLERGWVDQARLAVAELVAADPGRADLRLQLGRGHARAGLTDAARHELENAVALAPESRAASMQLATFLLNNGEQERAVELLSRLVVSDPADQEARIYLTSAAGEAATRRAAHTQARRDPFDLRDGRRDEVELAPGPDSSPAPAPRRGGGFLISKVPFSYPRGHASSSSGAPARAPRPFTANSSGDRQHHRPISRSQQHGVRARRSVTSTTQRRPAASYVDQCVAPPFESRGRARRGGFRAEPGSVARGRRGNGRDNERAPGSLRE